MHVLEHTTLVSRLLKMQMRSVRRWRRGEWKWKIGTGVAVSEYCILHGPAPLRIDLV
jgi:hypothetical protein